MGYPFRFELSYDSYGPTIDTPVGLPAAGCRASIGHCL
jgi:hypothetical protein